GIFPPVGVAAPSGEKVDRLMPVFEPLDRGGDEFLQGPAGEEVIVVIVLDDEDPVGGRHFPAPPATRAAGQWSNQKVAFAVVRAAPEAGASVAGSSIQNSAPAPRRESRPTDPPMRSAAFFTIARPIPVPGIPLPAARSNMRKIRSWSWG